MGKGTTKSVVGGARGTLIVALGVDVHWAAKRDAKVGVNSSETSIIVFGMLQVCIVDVMLSELENLECATVDE